MTPVVPRRWRVFPALALGTIVATLDISVVNLALPAIAAEYHSPLTRVSWVVLAYVLVITGLLLALGRLADRAGRRRLYALGLVIFLASSLACAAAPAVGWLIAARAVQGLGAAMMSANATALLVAAFPETERGRAIGAFGASVGVGLAAGPPLGGLVVSALSWRWLFLINLPIGLIALWLLQRNVPEDAPVAEPQPLGLASVVSWSAGLAALMVALSLGPERGGTSRTIAMAAGAAFVLLAAFAWAESRESQPLLPWDLLRGPLGPAAFLTLLGQVLSIAVAFLLPPYLEVVRGLDARHAGGWLAVLPVAALLCAPLAGRWSDRVGTRLLSVGGLLLVAGGDFLLARMGGSARGLLPGAILIGVGLGLFTVPNASVVMGSVPAHRLGLASGLQATMRNLGLAAGTAGAAALTTLLYRRATGEPLVVGPGAQGQALAAAICAAFLWLGWLAFGGAALAAIQPATKAGARG